MTCFYTNQRKMFGAWVWEDLADILSEMGNRWTERQIDSERDKQTSRHTDRDRYYNLICVHNYVFISYDLPLQKNYIKCI